MQPNDILRWRNALNFTQTDVATACGRERNWVRRIENGEIGIPRWFVYLAAWTRLYGLHVPFSPDETAVKMREFRKRWGLTQEELGQVLDLSRDVIIAAEKGRPRPVGIAFAIAWVDFYGSRLPFPSVPPGLVKVQCPKCLHKF
jgi:DNA-binding XRE family transcriptional regulator